MSRTRYPNTQAVVLEVAEAVSLALKDFHFGVGSFRDSVVAGEAPHTADFLAPGVQSMAELDEGREPATTQRGEVAEETVRQLAAAFLAGAVLQITSFEKLGIPRMRYIGDEEQNRVNV